MGLLDHSTRSYPILESSEIDHLRRQSAIADGRSTSERLKLFTTQ
jgi:hypothetical protein